MQFVQHLLIGLVVHVSIGIYGSYYVLHSVSGTVPGQTPGRDIDRAVYVWDSDRIDNIATLRVLPQSAREMRLRGLVTFGILGAIGILPLLILVLMGKRNLVLRRFLIDFLVAGPDWSEVDEATKNKYALRMVREIDKIQD